MEILTLLAVLALFSDDVFEQNDTERLEEIKENEKRFREQQEDLQQKIDSFLQNKQKQEQDFLLLLQRIWEKQQNDKRWQEYWEEIEAFWQEHWAEIAKFWEKYWEEIEQYKEKENLMDFLQWLENTLENAYVLDFRMKL